MKHLHILLCLFFTVTLTYTIDADVSGKLVIVHPVRPKELWVTPLNVGGETYKIYEHEAEPNFRILDVVTQKNGDYIAFLARSGYEAAGEYIFNIYIINKRHRGEKARNVTQNRFGKINERDFDLSKNGDLIFSCSPPPGNVAKGIYLITHSEFQKANPRTTLLVRNGNSPVWFPDGERIAYSQGKHIFFLTIATKKVITLKQGTLPAISPDGQYIALTHTIFGFTFQIEVHSLSPQRMLARTKHTKGFRLTDFKWSPDGKEIVSTSLSRHYAISFDERTDNLGEPIEFLDTDILGYHVTVYDWKYSGTYPVDPVDRLTTLWGEMKK